MRILAAVLALAVLIGCGTDDNNPTPAAPVEDLTFTVQRLNDRFDAIAKGAYYFNDQKEDWTSSAGLLPLRVTGGLNLVGGELGESEAACSGRTLKRITQAFTITVDGQTLSGSSDFIVSKVVALDDVYKVVRAEIALGDKKTMTGTCD